MKLLRTVAAVLLFTAAGFFNQGGCESTGPGNGGIAGTGIHGKVSTTVDENGKVGPITGEIYLAKKPLTPNEKKQTHDIAYAAGYAYASGLLPNQPGDEARFKYNLVKRLAYQWRVKYSIVKPIAIAAYEEGKKNAPPPNPPPTTSP